MSAKRRPPKPIAAAQPEPAGDRVKATPPATMFAKLVTRLKTLKGAIVAIAGVGAVLGGLAGYWNAYQATRGSTQSSQLLALVGKGDAGPLSIVVLPFANLTGDPLQAYLADGLTAAVTADLSRIRDAFIVSTATAFAYKDKPITVQQIGKELGVRFALQGGVQRSGDKVRINAQLADTTTNAQLWSESFDGTQGDLFALQEMVTIRINRSIGRAMIVSSARESETRRSNPKVSDLLLRARAMDLRPSLLKNYEEQRALYEQALTLEPNNAKALLGLAETLMVPAFNGNIADPVVSERQLDEGRNLALKVRELDPQNRGASDLLGIYAANHGNYEGAKHALETTLSLDRKDPAAYANLADIFFYAGDFQKAIELLSETVRIDPRQVHEFVSIDMGRAHFMLGNSDAAIEWLLKAIDTNPNYPNGYAWLAMAYVVRGDQGRARAATAELLRIDPKFSLARFDAPKPGFPMTHRAVWEKKLLPAGRLAGLPD